MSKTSLKKGLNAKKVFANVVSFDKDHKPTAFRITDKKGKVLKVVGNGLSC